jgi:hypothetical protein
VIADLHILHIKNPILRELRYEPSDFRILPDMRRHYSSKDIAECASLAVLNLPGVASL